MGREIFIRRRWYQQGNQVTFRTMAGALLKDMFFIYTTGGSYKCRVLRRLVAPNLTKLNVKVKITPQKFRLLRELSLCKDLQTRWGFWKRLLHMRPKDTYRELNKRVRTEYIIVKLGGRGKGET